MKKGDNIALEHLCNELNAGFGNEGLAPQNIQAINGTWQGGAIGRDAMMELCRRGELLPAERSMGEEGKPIAE